MMTSGASVMLIFSGVGLLLVPRDRQAALLLVLQYATAAWLVMQMWPLRMALIKVVAGWAAVLILFLSARQTTSDENRHTGSGSALFRLFTGLLALLALFSLLPTVSDAIPGIAPLTLAGAMWLMLSALLQLGFTLHPLYTVVGWLTLLTGFEILYASVERSTLIALLLAGLHLALALAGAYMLSKLGQEADEE